MKLAKKETAILYITLLVIGHWLIYTLLLEPSVDKYNELEMRVVEREKDLKEIVQLKEVYLKQEKVLEGINTQITQKEHNFAIFSFLEETASKVGIRSKITNMKPSETTFGDLYKESAVELKVEDITLVQLVDYLFQIENSNKLVKIKKIQIKARNDNPQILDMNCVIATYDLLKKI